MLCCVVVDLCFSHRHRCRPTWLRSGIRWPRRTGRGNWRCDRAAVARPSVTSMDARTGLTAFVRWPNLCQVACTLHHPHTCHPLTRHCTISSGRDSALLQQRPLDDSIGGVLVTKLLLPTVHLKLQRMHRMLDITLCAGREAICAIGLELPVSCKWQLSTGSMTGDQGHDSLSMSMSHHPTPAKDILGAVNCQPSCAAQHAVSCRESLSSCASAYRSVATPRWQGQHASMRYRWPVGLSIRIHTRHPFSIPMKSQGLAPVFGLLVRGVHDKL